MDRNRHIDKQTLKNRQTETYKLTHKDRYINRDIYHEQTNEGDSTYQLEVKYTHKYTDTHTQTGTHTHTHTNTHTLSL